MFLLRQDNGYGNHSQMLGKQNVVTGYLTGIKRSIKETIKNHTPVALFSGPKKITNISEQRVTSKALTEEGVVAIHTLTNSLLGVVYSSGLLRIWSIYLR